MPANKEAYIRYRIIDGALRDKRKPYPSLQRLVELCENALGKSFSPSTIQKDILAMRQDELLGFNAPIEFSKLQKGYHYTDEGYTISTIPLSGTEIDAIEFAAGILEQFRGTELHEGFDKAVDKILETLSIRRVLKNDQVENIIQVEKVAYSKGREHLRQLMEAIKRSNKIQLEYQSYDRNEPKKYLIHPYLLKEYRNRWYLIGFSEEYKEIRTFGLDRISSVRTEKSTYTLPENFEPGAFFKHSFGITVSDGKPEEVVLSFSPKGGKYVKSQPLHETQKIITDNSKEFRISLNVIISHELLMTIFSYGADVTVMKPKKLADQVLKGLKDAIANYQA